MSLGNMDAFLFEDGCMDDSLALGLIKDDDLDRVFLDAKDVLDLPPATKRKIDETEPDKETARKNAKREAYKKHIRKRQNEHADLKQQVQELEDQLQFLSNMKAIDATFASNWENIARDLASHRQESAAENEKLRQKVAEQSEFIETLQTLLAKRPRLAVFENDEWKALRLVADPSKRIHGMNALLHRQRQMLTGVFLQCGLLEPHDDDVHKVNVCSDITKMLISESVRFVRMNVPYPVLAEAAWNVSLGREITEKWGDNYKILETIDANTVYVEYVPRNGVADASGVLCARYLYRRYYEDNRVVIVWKSILEDECYPLDESVMRVHQSGWMVIEGDVKNPTQSLYKLFVQRHSPTRAGKLIHLTDVFQFIMPNISLEKRTTTYVTDFIVQSFRGVEVAFEKAIDVAVRKLTYHHRHDFMLTQAEMSL
ncbi:hypothetical protein SDRG_15840 [Saprolegnia diclina VS20]|uniref:START domain-containing protein n=1 Tax=Saprolegnia diclina (strain VS20) TaxID=1156394 RepID=T0PLU0_SAPDV|nr:hypothetical protein SDRG_15840 [Saprolegnia diclina VS20]EQC26354.1 hypothetical protein SDRG_15840 [Saprolegnia diclina VS20]|eukprot:XP_008620247.1 hypothetical protein SDRG_15840 [Saprolegnia diclina VS20]